MPFELSATWRHVPCFIPTADTFSIKIGGIVNMFSNLIRRSLTVSFAIGAAIVGNLLISQMAAAADFSEDANQCYVTTSPADGSDVANAEECECLNKQAVFKIVLVPDNAATQANAQCMRAISAYNAANHWSFIGGIPCDAPYGAVHAQALAQAQGEFGARWTIAGLGRMGCAAHVDIIDLNLLVMSLCCGLM